MQIEKGVEMPKVERKSTTDARAVIAEMVVGDSVVAPTEKEANRLKRVGRESGCTMVSARCDQGGYRVWLKRRRLETDAEVELG